MCSYEIIISNVIGSKIHIIDTNVKKIIDYKTISVFNAHLPIIHMLTICQIYRNNKYNQQLSILSLK